MLLIVCMESADISEELLIQSSQISLVPEQTIYFVDCNIAYLVSTVVDSMDIT